MLSYTGERTQELRVPGYVHPCDISRRRPKPGTPFNPARSKGSPSVKHYDGRLAIANEGMFTSQPQAYGLTYSSWHSRHRIWLV